MNPIVSGERFRHFGTDFDEPIIEIQSHMTSWSPESGRSNEGPHLATRGGHELGQLLCRHSAANHSRDNGLRTHQFDLITHSCSRLTCRVPPATTAGHDSPAGKHRNDPK